MKVLQIHGTASDSKIVIGESLGNLSEYIPAPKMAIITDTHVRNYYYKNFPDCEVIEIGTGEKIKNLDTVQTIYRKLLEIEADRSSFIVGIGGGIVCDITGFVASTYLRGVKFGFVPSTLLSQVDAAVGGKNGVNFGGYKNIVGVFNQPEFVICDLNLLKTLPEREILCGYAEIVKHAAIGDDALFLYLEDHYKYYEDMGYSIKKEYFFKIKEGFPRVISLPDGVGDIRYSIMLSACSKYVADIDHTMAALLRRQS